MKLFENQIPNKQKHKIIKTKKKLAFEKVYLLKIWKKFRHEKIKFDNPRNNKIYFTVFAVFCVDKIFRKKTSFRISNFLACVRCFILYFVAIQ